jgi:hypothetical protein
MRHRVILRHTLRHSDTLLGAANSRSLACTAHGAEIPPPYRVVEPRWTGKPKHSAALRIAAVLRSRSSDVAGLPKARMVAEKLSDAAFPGAATGIVGPWDTGGLARDTESPPKILELPPLLARGFGAASQHHEFRFHRFDALQSAG